MARASPSFFLHTAATGPAAFLLFGHYYAGAAQSRRSAHEPRSKKLTDESFAISQKVVVAVVIEGT